MAIEKPISKTALYVDGAGALQRLVYIARGTADFTPMMSNTLAL